MGRIEKTVFISYRHTNYWTALAVYQDLTAHGFDAFIDYQNLRSGEFDKVILENIRARAHFLVMLSPSALDRCNEPDDWMRREIETALDEKRNIVPLMMEGFDFGSPAVVKALTGKLSSLKYHQGLLIYPAYFPEGMERLRKDYLNVDVPEIVLHPLSNEAKELTEIRTATANETPLVEKDQLTAEEWFERGYKFDEAKDFDEAIRCYTEAINLQPDFAEAHNNRAVEYNKTGNPEAAIKDCAEVIRIRPNYANPYLVQGNARKAKGDLDSAIKDYTEAIRLKSNYADAYNNRGATYYSKCDFDNAIRDYDKALSIEPDDPEFHNSRGTVRNHKGDFDGAIADFNEAIHLKSDFVKVYYNRGYMYQLKGDLENAVKDYETAIRLEPDYGIARSSLTNVLRKLGRKTEADEQEKLARELIQKENEYNQACFESICENVDKALELLKTGLTKKQVTKEWARQDPDFENIRNDPRFRALVGE